MIRATGKGYPVNVIKYLNGTEFPAKKRDLFLHAKKNKAGVPILEELRNMPDREYITVEDVMKFYGKPG